MLVSKKYNMLYPKLIERILEEEQDIKSAKTRLHQLFGAYISTNAHKKAKAYLNDTQKILELHMSTKERLKFYPEFYSYIFSKTENIKTIMDLGCGFNPFSIPYMGFLPNKYIAIDIDMRTKHLLNIYFKNLNLPPLADCMDLYVEVPDFEVDICFIFKLLPILKEAGYLLIKNIKSKYIVITFPIKSLGGHEKGMGKNYAKSFEHAESQGLIGNYFIADRNIVGTELIYIMTTQM